MADVNVKMRVLSTVPGKLWKTNAVLLSSSKARPMTFPLLEQQL